MFTPDALLEAHRRTHLGTLRLLEHCRQLSAEELNRELPGFGYPTVQQQLHHIVAAEEYWGNVLARRPIEADRATDYPTLDALETYRAEVATATAAYLHGTNADALAAPTEFEVWGGERVTLLPEMVVLRLVTHPFHHRGQVAAMSRLLGYPPPASPALDFPIRPA